MKTTFDQKTNSIVNAETGGVIYTAPTGKKIIEQTEDMVNWTIRVSPLASKTTKPKKKHRCRFDRCADRVCQDGLMPCWDYLCDDIKYCRCGRKKESR